jgi:hypothetical protein
MSSVVLSTVLMHVSLLHSTNPTYSITLDLITLTMDYIHVWVIPSKTSTPPLRVLIIYMFLKICTFVCLELKLSSLHYI